MLKCWKGIFQFWRHTFLLNWGHDKWQKSTFLQLLCSFPSTNNQRWLRVLKRPFSHPRSRYSCRFCGIGHPWRIWVVLNFRKMKQDQEDLFFFGTEIVGKAHSVRLGSVTLSVCFVFVTFYSSRCFWSAWYGFWCIDSAPAFVRSVQCFAATNCPGCPCHIFLHYVGPM